MKFADNLKKIRKDNNLSQEQLAEKLGISRQAVSKWESGQSYPEMDKVVQICNMFNYNMDELINENIKEVDESKESKNISNKYITTFFDYLTKIVDLFSSMKFKQLVGCLFEQFIIGVILFFIFSIIGVICYGLISNLFYNIISYYKVYKFIISILEMLYVFGAIILSAIIMFHIFKIRYLDYYEIVNVSEEPDVTKVGRDNHGDDSSDIESSKNVLEKKKDKVIIRDPKHSDFKFISGLGKIMLFIVKFFVAWILFGFAVGFVGLITCLVLSFLFVKTGILFIGFDLATIGALIICGIFIELMYNFIFNRKNGKTRLLVFGIISLISMGIGTGLMVIGISEFDVAIEENYEVKDEYIFDMKDNLMIARYFSYDYNIEYIKEDRTDIKIEIEHSKNNISSVYEEDGFIYIHSYVSDEEVMNLIRKFISDFNNKKIVSYDTISNVKVYASHDNIDKMKANRKKYYDAQAISDRELSRLSDDNNRLENENYRLETILENNGYVVVRDSNGVIIEIYKDKYDNVYSDEE